jgi:hypothetical protein
MSAFTSMSVDRRFILWLRREVSDSRAMELK